VCDVWRRAAASIGIDAAAFRFVRIDQSLVPRDDDGPVPAPRPVLTGGCPERAP
jgi:hypothetical protein